LKNTLSFLFKSLVVGLPILICLISVNSFVDSAHLLDSSFEKSLIDPILEGKNLTNLKNFDDRAFNLQVIRSPLNPSFIVLGSSRSLQVRIDSNKTDFFNHSVYGATLEDIVGIYQLYKENGKQLETILIDAEPWYFNKNRGESRWKVFEQQVANFQNFSTNPSQSAQGESYFMKYRQLISPSYFQINVKNIGKSLKVEITDKEENQDMTRLYDGSVTYGIDNLRSMAKQKVVTDRIPMLEDYFEMDTNDVALFEKMIKDMMANGIKVNLLMFPYHPDVYKKISANKRYGMVQQVEQYYHNLSDSLGIDLKGSFDPERCGLNASDFMDFSHLKKEGVRKLLKGTH
jgi:hypothetical protein